MSKSISNSQKESTASKSLPEVIWDTFEFVLFFCFLILLGNPVSMFFINLVMPSWAAVLAHYFAITLEWKSFLNFYRYLAKKMPYRWRKAWMKKDHELSYYTDEDQYRFVTEGEGKLSKISKNAQQMYWQNICSANYTTPLIEDMRKEFIDACGCTDEMFRSLLIKGDYKTLNHAAKKTLKYNKMAMLICYAFFGDTHLEQKHSFESKGSEEALKLLLRIIAREGIDAKFIPIIEAYKVHRVQEVSSIYEALNIYRQKVFANIITEKINKASDEKEIFAALANWRKFCLNTDNICEDAQIQMNELMYNSFHETDHKMCESAIISFMQHSDLAMCEHIFKSEPEHGILSDEIRNVMYALPKVYKLYISSIE